MTHTLSMRTVLIGLALILGIAAVYDMQRTGNGFSPTSGGVAQDKMMYDDGMAIRGEMAAPAPGIAPMAPIYPPDGGTADLDAVMREDRLIVRNGWMSAVVRNVQRAADELKAHTESIGGFVSSSSLSGLETNPTAYIVLRVPVEQFDALIAHVRNTSLRVVSESVSGDDVTEQYVDAEARLRTLRASEEQFLEIMQRSTRIEDVLNVQQQLERVRTQIESTEARLQHLERSARLSTLSVQFSLEERQLPLTNPAEPWDPLATFRQALRDFRTLLIGVLDGIILLSPYLALGAVVYVGYRVVRRRKS